MRDTGEKFEDDEDSNGLVSLKILEGEFQPLQSQTGRTCIAQAADSEPRVLARAAEDDPRSPKRSAKPQPDADFSSRALPAFVAKRFRAATRHHPHDDERARHVRLLEAVRRKSRVPSLQQRTDMDASHAWRIFQVNSSTRRADRSRDKNSLIIVMTSTRNPACFFGVSSRGGNVQLHSKNELWMRPARGLFILPPTPARAPGRACRRAQEA